LLGSWPALQSRAIAIFRAWNGGAYVWIGGRWVDPPPRHVWERDRWERRDEGRWEHRLSLSYPPLSYYFFCTVTDTGVSPNRSGTNFVRVYETNGPIARISISPPTILTDDTVSFEGRASTEATGMLTGWSIDYGGSTVPLSLEGDLQLSSWTNRCGRDTPCPSTGLTLVHEPFARPGIYRVQLTVHDARSNEATSTEYFTVLEVR